MIFTQNQIDNAADEKIGALITELTGWDQDQCAYVLIAKDFGSGGEKVFANTSEPDQIIALMHLTLMTMTVGKLWPDMNVQITAAAAPPGQGRPDPAG